MQAVREIVDSSVFDTIFRLPAELKNRRVEVVIFPAYGQAETLPRLRPEEYTALLKLNDAEDAVRTMRNEWERC